MRAKRHAARAFFEDAKTKHTEKCIEWPYGLNSHGRPYIGDSGGMISAALLMCIHMHGPRPDKKEAAHLCGNEICINHRHIVWATHSENEMHKILHGTDRRGERHPMCKLTEPDVLSIRELARQNVTQRSIAAQYGVSSAQINKIVTRQQWKHI